jgi:fluoride exporter
VSTKVVLGTRRKPLDVRELVAIFLGGATGALLRVGLERAFTVNAGSWPWVTFAINVSGSFALAYVATRLLEHPPQARYPLALLGPGFCGTYTTFSTMQLEILQMFDHGHVDLAGAYAFASVSVGYLAIQMGMALARPAPVAT